MKRTCLKCILILPFLLLGMVIESDRFEVAKKETSLNMVPQTYAGTINEKRINSSAIVGGFDNAEKILVSYDMEYKRVKYEKIVDFTYQDQFFGYIGSAVNVNVSSHRVIGLANGSLLVLNSTNPTNIKYNVTYWNTVALDTSDFQPVKLFEFAQNYFYIVGTNKTDKSVIVRFMRINNTVSIPSIHHVWNWSIPIPSGFNLQSSVPWFSSSYLAGSIGHVLISGKYVNITGSGNMNVPFLYDMRIDTGALINYLGYQSGDLWVGFDDVVFKANLSGLVLSCITNKRFICFYKNDNTTIINETLPNEIVSTGIVLDFMNKVNENIPQSNYSSWIAYTSTSLVTSKSILTLIQFNIGTNDSLITANDTLCWRVEGYGTDNIFMSQTGTQDTVYVLGIDKNLISWNTFPVSTGITHGILNNYMPIDYLLPIQYNESAIELYFADNKALWVVTFSNRLNEYYNIGNYKISSISTTGIDISHSRGTKPFNYRINGFLERNDTGGEIVEIGIVPFMMTTLHNTFFTSDAVYSFRSQREILIKPITNFVGFGRDFIEFYLEFESDFCATTYELVDGIELMDVNLAYVVYEKYNNGTYNQVYLDSLLQEIKSSVLDYNYELETQIQIEDSHLLNELHVFSGDIEYDPYNLFFLNSTSEIVIADKVTGVELYNESFVVFSDPLIVNIPSKYEFFIKYYSNIDGFGIDFNRVNTSVNGTELTTQFVRVLSPDAELIVKDFFGSILLNRTVNKFIDGQYVSLGLDVIEIFIKNNYNFTVNFFLIKSGVEISYSIPPQTDQLTRIALGTYQYVVTDEEGNELYNQNATFSINAQDSISFGFTEVTPDNIYLTSLLDYVIYMVTFAAFMGVMIYISIRISRRRNNNKRKKRETKKNDDGSVPEFLMRTKKKR